MTLLSALGTYYNKQVLRKIAFKNKPHQKGIKLNLKIVSSSNLKLNSYFEDCLLHTFASCYWSREYCSPCHTALPERYKCTELDKLTLELCKMLSNPAFCFMVTLIVICCDHLTVLLRTSKGTALYVSSYKIKLKEFREILERKGEIYGVINEHVILFETKL